MPIRKRISRLTALQAKAYEWLYANYAGKLFQTRKHLLETLAKVCGTSPASIYYQLNALARRKMIELVHRGTNGDKINPTTFRLPKKKKEYTAFFGRNKAVRKQRILDVINEAAAPDRATSFRMTQDEIAEITGIPVDAVNKLIKELESENLIIKANRAKGKRAGQSLVYDQSQVINVQIDGKHAIITGKFTVQFAPKEE